MDSRKWLIVALVVCGLASACSQYNTNLSIQTSSSVLTFVSPSSATVGSQGFTITANGSGFTAGALILWNGTALTTTLVSGIQLTAPVPPSLLNAPGTVQIAVQIPGSATSGTNINSTTTTEVSNVVLFTIGAAPGAPPAITSLSASTSGAASTPYCSPQNFTLTVNGTNFTSDSAVSWNGVEILMPISSTQFVSATTFVSSTQLTALVPAALAAFPGTASIAVTNSIGTSASSSFTLSTPAGALANPTLASSDVAPISIPAGSPSFALLPLNSTTGLPANALVIGSASSTFLPCTVVEWTNGSGVTIALPTEYIPAEPTVGSVPGHPLQLNAAVPSSVLLGAGTAHIVLSNPPPVGPQGSTSNPVSVTIAPPAVTSVTSSTTSSSSTPSCSTSGFTLTVNGSNFLPTSIVNWNGSARATTFVQPPPTQPGQNPPPPYLTALISSADIASAGTASITVTNGGVMSNSVPFTISASTLPAATITSISPVGATAGTAAFPLIVTGTNFLPCSSVQWTDSSNNVTALPTTYVSPTQLSASVSPANLSTVETVQVAVANPASTSNISATISFPIALPTITSLSASSSMSNTTPECSPDGITLTVNGTNFVPNGLVVNWNGSPRQTTYVSATQLTAVITATDTAFPGTVNITVSSAALPLLASAASPFTIAPSTTPLPVPVITTLLPSNVAAGSASFLLGVDGTSTNGGSLLPCSVVEWNGSPRTTTFTSLTGLNAAISAADVANAAAVPVTVFTLTDGGGGGTSNALTFTVFTPPVSASQMNSSLARTATNVASATVAASPSLPAPILSAGKRYAVAVLASADGVTEIPGAHKNVFVHDACKGATVGCTPSVSMASIGLDSNPADGDSISPSISADGRYVAFLSSSMNLVDSDTNGVVDVFVRDTCAGVSSGCTPSTQRVSLATDGTQANAASTAATVSATGRYVTFVSAATNLGFALPSASGIFLRDTCIGAALPCTPSTQPLQ